MTGTVRDGMLSDDTEGGVTMGGNPDTRRGVLPLAATKSEGEPSSAETGAVLASSGTGHAQVMVTSGAALATAELGALLRVGVGRLYRRFRSERVSGELGDTAIAVLGYLHREGARTLTELSDRDRVTPASMSQIVNRLASAGYIVRGPDPDDRRKVRFTATPEGSALAVTVRAEREAWLIAHLERLNAEDRGVLARAAVLLREIADAQD